MTTNPGITPLAPVLPVVNANTALTPLPAAERSFGFRDHAALWLERNHPDRQ